MDPVSLGLVTAALLATRAGEGAADEAGHQAWSGLASLGARIKARLTGQSGDALTRLGTPDENPTDRAAVGTSIDLLVKEDPSIGLAIEYLIGQVNETESGRTLVARAYDQARQINIAGDNLGPINMA